MGDKALKVDDTVFKDAIDCHRVHFVTCWAIATKTFQRAHFRKKSVNR